MGSAVNFFHLGMNVSAYRSIRVPRVSSISRALLEHRWYIGGTKLACFPLALAKPLLRKPYTRDAYASMSRYLSRPRRKYFFLLFFIQFRTDPSFIFECAARVQASIRSRTVPLNTVFYADEQKLDSNKRPNLLFGFLSQAYA